MIYYELENYELSLSTFNYILTIQRKKFGYNSILVAKTLNNIACIHFEQQHSCNYNNSSSNDVTYGKLYNWYAVNTSKLCPTGWHVPTESEWTVLTDYLTANGHSGAEGNALKATSGWNNGGNGTDDFGFLGLPGGYRSYYNGTFYSIGGYGYWWSSSLSSTANARSRYVYSTNDYVNSYNTNKKNGFSVRCLRD